ncbi:phosphoglycolate phosphatase [Aureimonas phyllosphaerae]|uniref:Phosphoglycolate phosphatase n=1 Tax=Aureimonas phyllosphaerae TaxID=1166078 RepID=A0A7W6BZZ4_9HYPH|nr:phosphoglycolate phosphatase [Aureimonas phyllosphaerae]MBB3935877.1 phosphoglycolate phosphatase [Aureimonas phyllosphaerae]MBB3959885.1 phosphoglycolate phosphatase [Aureimonas phyllosphaerae]SFF16148.1 phosphoglycolate phosphatase [Aureimonas phyllosphaerae]
MSEAPAWPRAVLFDLDGTLVDSLPDIHAALNETLESLGEPPFTIEAVGRMVGQGVQILIGRAYEALDKEIDPATRDKIAERYLAIYAARSTELTTLNAGATDCVRILAERGIPLGVVTNKPGAETADILAHFGLADRMAVVVGGDAGPRKKPAPDLVVFACRQLGIEPGEALFVGDSENDVEAAQAAGMAVVAMRGGYTAIDVETMGADLVLDRLDDIPNRLPEIAARRA